MLELIGVDRLTQWDVGRQINVDKDVDMVHFSNRPYGYSKNVKVTDGVADVPDMFLTSCAPLRVWAYVGDFEKGYTKIEKIYEVKPKNRPEDYIYTPEEVKTWEKLQSEIGNLSDLATEAKENLVAAINEVEADMSEGVALDTTLTQSGQAADAKAVGDALAEKQPKGNYLTQDNLQSATNAALAQAKASGEFDCADGKSAYQYAQDGGYTGTETEFAEKLAKEIPEALPNPNALTLTGAVNATYDGSTAVSVEIPSGGGTDISLGLTSAAVGQIIKVKAIDESGKPTAWEAADMSGDRWELINAIEIADGTEETNALTINTDKNGNTFSLKKARLITYFPKYTGESSIPGYSFTMINGFVSGPQSPLCYTEGLPVPNKSKNPEGWLEVDLSMPGYEVERVARFAGAGGRPAELMHWGARRLNGAETITSIGGINMLIYPGCKFTLYGVRA